MKSVGIRELRDNLSRYLEEVKEGQAIYITSRGVPVARISPVSDPVDPGISDLLDTGQAQWNGGKPQGNPSPPCLKGKKSMSDTVSEDRR